MKIKNTFNKIISKKYIFIPLISILLFLLIGGGVFASSLMSKSKRSKDVKKEASNDEEVIEESFSDEVSEAEHEDETAQELEEVPDFEGDEVYEEETKDEVDEDDEETDKSKNTRPYYIKINKTHNTITVYGLDENGKYTIPVKAIICSTGKATPLGKFNTKVKYKWKLLNGNVWGQYSTRIHGSILFHSVPMNAQRKDTVRYRSYNRLGTTASAGCVRVTTADAKWLFDNCPVGTTVEIYKDSSSPGPLGKPVAIKVPTNVSSGWDPTDPDPQNPWNSKGPSITGATNKTVERGTDFDIRTGIKALDTVGNDISSLLIVTGLVDASVIGDYEVEYSITDAVGRTASQTVTYYVQDTTGPEIVSNLKDVIIPQSVGKSNSDLEKYLRENIVIKDKGNPNHLDVLGAKITIKYNEKNWSYKIDIDAKDDNNNLAKTVSIVLYDPIKVELTKSEKTPKEGVKNVQEALKYTNAKLINNRTAAKKDLVAKAEVKEGQIEVSASYSDGVRTAQNKVTLNKFSPTPMPTTTPTPTPTTTPTPTPTTTPTTPTPTLTPTTPTPTLTPTPTIDPLEES